MIYKHNCLEGRERLGDSWDCTRCRVLLLEAFRPSPEVSEEDIIHATGIGNQAPHLMVPADRTRTVDLTHPSEGSVLPPERHTTHCSAEPFRLQDGGHWLASCLCGWTARGFFTGAQGAAYGYGQAQSAADYHREHPEERDEDQ